MKIVKENDIYKTVKIGATYKAMRYYKTLTINPIPSDANVTFSKGIISGNNATVDEGSSVTYSVSKNGYSTYTDTIIVSEDMTINVELQEGYPSGTVLFENGTPGTYTINIEANCTIHLDMCGAGGAGVLYKMFKTYRWTGGQGGYIYGETDISAGTYTIIVGAANEGYSSFNENIANGGTNAQQYADGSGGSTTVVSSGLTGSNGGVSTASRILTYGGGGYGESSGQNGYCKIITV